MARKKASNSMIGLDVNLSNTEAFIEKHLKSILIVIAAIIVVVAGIYIYKMHINSQTEEADEAIAKCQVAFAQGQYEQALNGDAANGLLKIIDEYSGTKTANIAKLYAGLCYAKLNRTDEAISMLEGYSAQDDQIISPAALGALGDCYVTKGQNEKGAETMLKAAKVADNDAVSPVFLLKAGKIYEELGKADKAVELYKEIKTKYFRSPLATDIDKYIERASK